MTRFFRDILCLAFISILVPRTLAMEYKYNGGHQMPSLGLGTSEIGDEREAETVLNTALEIGYGYFDTAPFYQTEKIVGKVLTEWLSSGKLKREDVFVVTKLDRENMFSGQVETALNSSLEKLQLDYVDLYLIHIPVAMKRIKGKLIPQPTDSISVWKEMEEQVRLGKAKTIGLSNFNISQIQRIQKIAKIQPASIQVEAHVNFQQHELYDFSKINNLTMIAFSPLGSPATVKKQGQESVYKNILKDPVVETIADKHNKSAAQVALRFLIQSGWAVIPKSSNPERLAQNFNIFDYTLDDEDMESLEKLDKGKNGRVIRLNHAIGDPEYPFQERRL